MDQALQSLDAYGEVSSGVEVAFREPIDRLRRLLWRNASRRSGGERCLHSGRRILRCSGEAVVGSSRWGLRSSLDSAVSDDWPGRRNGTHRAREQSWCSGFPVCPPTRSQCVLELGVLQVGIGLGLDDHDRGPVAGDSRDARLVLEGQHALGHAPAPLSWVGHLCGSPERRPLEPQSRCALTVFGRTMVGKG